MDSKGIVNASFQYLIWFLAAWEYLKHQESKTALEAVYPSPYFHCTDIRHWASIRKMCFCLSWGIMPLWF